MGLGKRAKVGAIGAESILGLDAGRADQLVKLDAVAARQDAWALRIKQNELTHEILGQTTFSAMLKFDEHTQKSVTVSLGTVGLQILPNGNTSTYKYSLRAAIADRARSSGTKQDMTLTYKGIYTHSLFTDDEGGYVNLKGKAGEKTAAFGGVKVDYRPFSRDRKIIYTIQMNMGEATKLHKALADRLGQICDARKNQRRELGDLTNRAADGDAVGRMDVFTRLAKRKMGFEKWTTMTAQERSQLIHILAETHKATTPTAEEAAAA